MSPIREQQAETLNDFALADRPIVSDDPPPQRAAVKKTYLLEPETTPPASNRSANFLFWKIVLWLVFCVSLKCEAFIFIKFGPRPTEDIIILGYCFFLGSFLLAQALGVMVITLLLHNHERGL